MRIVQKNELLSCNSDMVNPANLQNPYMDLHIFPATLDGTDPDKDLGAALLVSSTLNRHGVEGVQVAKEFYQELELRQPEKPIATGIHLISDSIFFGNPPIFKSAH